MEKETRSTGMLIDPITGLHRCQVCGSEWLADIKPSSGGRYWRGSKCCPQGCAMERLEEIVVES